MSGGIRDDSSKNIGYDWNGHSAHVRESTSLNTAPGGLHLPSFDWAKATAGTSSPKKKRQSSGIPRNDEPSFNWETSSPKSVITESPGYDVPSFDWAQARREKMCKSKSLGNFVQPPSPPQQAPSFDWRKSASFPLPPGSTTRPPRRRGRGSKFVRTLSTDSGIQKKETTSDKSFKMRKSRSVDNLVVKPQVEPPSFDWKRSASVRLPPRMPQRRQGRRSQGSNSNLGRTRSTDSGIITRKRDKAPPRMSKSKSFDSLIESSSPRQQQHDAPSFDWKKSASYQQKLSQPRQRRGSSLVRAGNKTSEKTNKSPIIRKSESLNSLARPPPPHTQQQEDPTTPDWKNPGFLLLPCMPQLPRWQSRPNNSAPSQSNSGGRGNSVKPPKMPSRKVESQEPDSSTKESKKTKMTSLQPFNLGPARIFERFLGKQV